MLTIRDYNKENLDRSSITIVDRYLSIVGDKENEITNIKNATLSIYSLIYWYINDARNKLKELNDLVDEWEDKTGIDATPIRDEIKHTEAMTDVVEEITDDSYDDDDDDETVEEKTSTVENTTKEIVTVVKENPEIKEEVKTEVKTDITPTPTPTPSTPVAPAPTIEEIKENARQEAAESIRNRSDDGRGRDFTYETEGPKGFDRIMEVLMGGGIIPSASTDTSEGTRALALDEAAAVIENGGTAQEAVDAYLVLVNPPAEGASVTGNYYSPTDETAQTINEDIQAIIDAANEAASSESSDSGGSDTPSCDEPSCDEPPCDDCDCDCDTCDEDCCVADEPEPCSSDICVQE